MKIYPDDYDLHKRMQYTLGYLAGTIQQWRKRCSFQFVLGYLSGLLRR
jgi:hypothetical protein